MSLSTPPRTTGFPIVDRILDGTAPAAARAAGARGALPVPRELMLTVLAYLLEDPDRKISGDARQTLEKYPSDELTDILADPGTDPRVLGFFAVSASLKGVALNLLVANPSLRDESLVLIAAAGSPAAIDALLVNQQRLTLTPSAVEALLTNESLNTDQRRRLLDFVEHLGRPAAAPEPQPVEPLDPELLGPVSEEELRSMLGTMSDLPFIDLEVGEFLKGDSLIEADADLEALGTSFESVFKQLLRMNPGQRLRAALRGGREARTILVRDNNRIVASAVLRNPRLTEDEVVSFAAQKSLSEDVLRQIGGLRSWLGCYSVIVNLVRNPKTPQSIAMNNLGRINSKDLTLVTRDRNIPEVIRRMAKKHLEMRAPKKLFKKH